MNQSLDHWSRYTEIYVRTKRTASSPKTNDIIFIERGQFNFGSHLASGPSVSAPLRPYAFA